MADLFTLENLFTLGMLTLLQAVLGFDNLLYISLESKRAPVEKRAQVRRLGIGLAVGFRIVLLFVLMELIQFFQDPLFAVHATGILEFEFNLHGLIVVLGGVFILYTAVKEIMHMIAVDDLHEQDRAPSSVTRLIMMIVVMNLVFSFDSILSAMALSDVFAVMATAILIGGALMIWMADRVADFLQRNRMYEVLGLFILFIVGIMLLSEGGHLAHLKLMGHDITPMNKATFYFVIVVLVLIDVVQGRYQKKLLQRRERAAQRLAKEAAEAAAS